MKHFPGVLEMHMVDRSCLTWLDLVDHLKRDDHLQDKLHVLARTVLAALLLCDFTAVL